MIFSFLYDVKEKEKKEKKEKKITSGWTRTTDLTCKKYVCSTN